jgi:hypothetical protein
MSNPIPTPTETDYRAVLAYLWTFLTFALLFYLIYKGLDINGVAVLSTIFILDTTFINAYFKDKSG